MTIEWEDGKSVSSATVVGYSIEVLQESPGEWEAFLQIPDAVHEQEVEGPFSSRAEAKAAALNILKTFLESDLTKLKGALDDVNEDV